MVATKTVLPVRQLGNRQSGHGSYETKDLDTLHAGQHGALEQLDKAEPIVEQKDADAGAAAGAFPIQGSVRWGVRRCSISENACEILTRRE
jgi:hypothetical protein